jgi:hypothetical protein
MQLLSLVIAAVLGVLIVASKVSAQPPAAAGGATPAGPKVLPGASAKLGAPAATTVSKDAGPSDAGPSDAGASVDLDASPIDYAEIQTDADFPAEMSEEEKAVIGIGKVPIHREGHFKSPFAHPRFGGPTTAEVGLVLADISGYDIQTGTFEADFFLSLTGDKEMGPVALTFTNGKEVTETVIADTPTFKLFRYHGSFVSPVDLRKYPFDTQALTIEMEDLRAGVDQLVLKPNPSRTSLDEGFVISGWGVTSIAAKAYKHMYPARFDRDDLYVSRYKFQLGVDRFATSAAFSVFVPAFIIVLISLMGLWVKFDDLEVRSNAGAPMLAAAVLFHYSLIQALPATGYLTRADKLMLGVYISLLLNMGSIWIFLVTKEENVEKVFKICRTWVPILTAVVMALGSIG